MIPEKFSELLHNYKAGKVSEQKVKKYVKNLAFESLEFAKVDHHRLLRKGFPEVIFCQGKKSEYVAEIAQRIVRHGNNLLATRANPENFEAVREVLPLAEYNSLARTITVEVTRPRIIKKRSMLIISAGTSDIPVAEEAAVTGKIMGNRVNRIFDVGVAGIHRLLNYRKEIDQAKVIIVVAGMEGALASVIGGLVDKPVIAVPTSVGYGASFNGIASLLGMLNSCAAGVTVVNIDNGFGAAYAASLMLQNI